MNCPTCYSEMVLAKATSFGEEYHYCRSCKKELSEMPQASPTPVTTTGWEEVDRALQERGVTTEAKSSNYVINWVKGLTPCFILGNGATQHQVDIALNMCCCGDIDFNRTVLP